MFFPIFAYSYFKFAINRAGYVKDNERAASYIEVIPFEGSFL